MKKKLLIYLFVGIVLFRSVLAADLFSTIIDPLQSVFPQGLYNQSNYYFLDAVVYLLIFLGLGKFALKKYEKGSTAITIGVGLALTFAASYYEYTSGFMLGSLAPVAMLVILFIFVFLFYELFRGMGANMVFSVSSAIIIGYAMLRVPFGVVYEWIVTNAPIVSFLLHFALIIAVVLLIIQLVRLFGSGGNGEDHHGREDGNGNGRHNGGGNGEGGDGDGDGDGDGGHEPELAVNITGPRDPVGPNDHLILQAEVNGGRAPYHFDWLINGRNVRRGRTDHEVNTDLGVVRDLHLENGPHDFSIRVTDNSGHVVSSESRFTINIADIAVHILNPNERHPQPVDDQDLEVVFSIEGGVKPYRWIAVMNRDPNRHLNNMDAIADFVVGTGETRMNDQRVERHNFTIDRDQTIRNPEAWRVGQDNNLFVWVADRQGHRGVGAVRFNIRRGGRPPAGLNIEFEHPPGDGSGEFRPNQRIDFVWNVTNDDVGDDSRFVGEYMLHSRDGVHIDAWRRIRDVQRRRGNFHMQLPAGNYEFVLRLTEHGTDRQGQQNVRFRVAEGGGDLVINLVEPRGRVRPNTAFRIMWDITNDFVRDDWRFRGRYMFFLSRGTHTEVWTDLPRESGKRGELPMRGVAAGEYVFRLELESLRENYQGRAEFNIVVGEGGGGDEDWIDRIRGFLSDLQAVGQRTRKYHSTGSFGADFVARPSRLNLTKTPKTVRALVGILKILKANESKVSETYYKQFIDNYAIMRDNYHFIGGYKKHGTQIRHICSLLGVDPTSGQGIESVINDAAINDEPDGARKNNMIALRNLINSLYNQYVNFFAALKELKEAANLIVKNPSGR